MLCQMLRAENHLRSADVELQQRAVEYLQLSNVASTDVLVSRTYMCTYHIMYIYAYIITYVTLTWSYSGELWSIWSLVLSPPLTYTVLFRL